MYWVSDKCAYVLGQYAYVLGQW